MDTPEIVDEGELFDTNVTLTFDTYRIVAKAQTATSLVEASVDGTVAIDGMVNNLLTAEARQAVTADLASYARELADALLAVLPDAGIGNASVHQVPAAAQTAAAQPTPANQAVPSGGSVFTVTNKYGSEIYSVGVDVLSSQDLQDGAIAKLCDKFKFDPSQVVAFDDRPEYRRGHVGNIQFRKDSPGAGVLGGKAIAWIDLNADGTLKLTPTKDFKDLVLPNVDLQLELRQPFTGAAGGGSVEEAF
jgi:hypothetical protein